MNTREKQEINGHISNNLVRQGKRAKGQNFRIGLF